MPHWPWYCMLSSKIFVFFCVRCSWNRFSSSLSLSFSSPSLATKLTFSYLSQKISWPSSAFHLWNSCVCVMQLVRSCSPFFSLSLNQADNNVAFSWRSSILKWSWMPDLVMGGVPAESVENLQDYWFKWLVILKTFFFYFQELVGIPPFVYSFPITTSSNPQQFISASYFILVFKWCWDIWQPPYSDLMIFFLKKDFHVLGCFFS